MEIDHIFIFSTAAGHEADELAALGFVEGSSRRHPGQGTTNRKFYCENFFLEILWVVDYAELTSERLRTTQLRQRASFHQTGTSPFGLCLVNTPDTDALFAEAVTYQPAYFPPGKTIEVLPNQHRPGLPWTFRLPFTGTQTTPAEPLQHPNGIQRLTRTEFEIQGLPAHDPFVTHFQHEQALTFEPAAATRLRLTFDHHRQRREQQLASLPLLIRY